MNSRKHIEGFTLVELMVAITLVGILAAMSAANLMEFKTYAYNAQGISMTRNVFIAQEAYRSETLEEDWANCATEDGYTVGGNCEDLFDGFGYVSDDNITCFADSPAVACAHIKSHQGYTMTLTIKGLFGHGCNLGNKSCLLGFVLSDAAANPDFWVD